MPKKIGSQSDTHFLRKTTLTNGKTIAGTAVKPYGRIQPTGRGDQLLELGFRGRHFIGDILSGGLVIHVKW